MRGRFSPENFNSENFCPGNFHPENFHLGSFHSGNFHPGNFCLGNSRPGIFSLSLRLLGFFLAAFLMFSGPAWGSATLYRGGNALGSVPTTNGPNAEPWVSLTDTGALLGFQASLSGEELHLVRGDVRFRIVLDAVAAWRDLYLIPLYGAAFERDGRWWLDIPSVSSSRIPWLP